MADLSRPDLDPRQASFANGRTIPPLPECEGRLRGGRRESASRKPCHRFSGQLSRGTTAVFPGSDRPSGQVSVLQWVIGNPIETPACTLTLPLGSHNQARASLNRDAALYAQDTWRAWPRLT